MVLHGSLHFKKKGIYSMKFIYPAVFRPTEDKKYNAFFRILPAVKPTVTRWMMPSKNANAAAYDWIFHTELLWNLRESFLPVSDESDLELQEGDVVRNIL